MGSHRQGWRDHQNFDLAEKKLVKSSTGKPPGNTRGNDLGAVSCRLWGSWFGMSLLEYSGS